MGLFQELAAKAEKKPETEVPQAPANGPADASSKPDKSKIMEIASKTFSYEPPFVSDRDAIVLNGKTRDRFSPMETVAFTVLSGTMFHGISDLHCALFGDGKFRIQWRRNQRMRNVGMDDVLAAFKGLGLEKYGLSDAPIRDLFTILG